MTNVLDAYGPAAVAYAELGKALYALNEHLVDLFMTTQLMQMPGFRHEHEVLNAYLGQVREKGLLLGQLLWPDEP